MIQTLPAHTFHIPVMGLGFTIDTPLKVARFGISSVISIIEHELIEKMREFHCRENDEVYEPITEKVEDYRAKRITEYLNLLDRLINKQVEKLRLEPFIEGTEITKYFELLPDSSPIKQTYIGMLQLEDSSVKKQVQDELRNAIVAGSIDVNVMSKVDRTHYDENGEMLPKEYSDALSSFRGYAQSNLTSSIVFSAGYNPRLYGYIDTFNDFFPDENGFLKKKIILKVSDYRSALTQGKILAKKGLWVSEFRIESGLNCGGHAFATDGLLLGPIMEEFKQNRTSLQNEILEVCNQALLSKGLNAFEEIPKMKITVQGGIGTANEDNFLLEYYDVDGTGWASPFLLVPEATNVDDETLQKMANAQKNDYFLSNASPLGVPFNNFKHTSGEEQRLKRIEKNRAGSPCYKKFLSTNTEFTKEPICESSREYLHAKIKQIKASDISEADKSEKIKFLEQRDCLCEGLGVSALLKHDISPAHKLTAVTICPGPNLAYFSGVFSLKQMVDHIYGRTNILNSLKRPNMFVNELVLYVDYYKNQINKQVESLSAAQIRSLKAFHTNLLSGIDYYKSLVSSFKNETERYIEEMKEELINLEQTVSNLQLPFEVAVK
ncbi:hypothetical protein Emtol_2379 [Emticicia oligotrophica DSM 17448]|uniref:Uncharacterized protein n=1 Tax=Emticicia oligotrophica (strain DSM 17448 / CIP 109782 / MTCC 6937 / GPTSA100-15) TaxID=929562 RepID=A0ABN4AMF4_EMTOG|nr:hypothetical protein [Emticicia oligotrophica]AFK03516.1 hypothetical protein Emtol_2379 [Emticicia oligotrophica DSM 17448]